jgi:hypothetical protein
MNGTIAKMFRSLRRLTAPQKRRSRSGPKRAPGTDPAILELQLQTVRERCRAGCELFIFLPSAPWRLEGTGRSQTFARELAKAGHVVIYDGTGTIADGAGIKELEPNLFLYRGASRLLAGLPDPILWAVIDNVSQRMRYPQMCRMVYDFTESPDVLRRIHERAMDDATLVVSAFDENAAPGKVLLVPRGEEAIHAAELVQRLQDAEAVYRSAA